MKIFEEIGGYDNMIVTVGESGSFASSSYSNKSSIEVILPDAQDQTVTVDEMKELIADNLPGVTEPSTDMDEGLPQLEVVIDRERAYDLGLNMYTVATEIAAGIDGKTATTYRVGGEELDLFQLTEKMKPLLFMSQEV